MDPAATPADLPADTPAAPAAAPADPRQLTRQRRRALWLAGTLAALAIVGSAAWLVNVVTTERTLHAVTSAPLPALPGQPPAMAPLAAGAAVQAAPVAAAPAALAAAAAPPQAPPAAAGPAASEVAAQPVRQASKAAKGGKGGKGGKRAAVRRVAKRSADSATFRRCPPLGQAGAVMCRWHICNGGAGKEAACRPYLERRP